MINTSYIFVYGTLMRGFKIKESLAFKKISKFVGEASIKGMVFTNGYYPALITTNNYFRVSGELFKLKSIQKSLSLLDKYENAYYGEREYVRKAVLVKLKNGTSIMAHVYIYNKKLKYLTNIPSGKYSPPKRKKFSITMQP